MRLFLAIFLPFVTFFMIERNKDGIICLLLQLTILGWVPAAFWSVYSLITYETDQKLEKLARKK